MATSIMNKKTLMEWVNRNIKANQVILMTQDKVGNITINGKRKQNSLTFAYSTDAFKDEDSIADIAFRIPTVCFAICDKKEVSKEALDLFKTIK